VIAVLDTNVLVSGMINPSGPPGRLVDLLRAGALFPAVDDRILAEYADVLRRPELATWFRASDVEHVLDYLRGNSRRVLATLTLTTLPDPTDAPFLEVALAAEAPLVTGNARHFPPDCRHGAEVIAPADWLARYASA